MDQIDRLGLLASAVSGRPLQVAAAGRGQAAWTDGATVFVDADAPMPAVTVTVQAALVASGSLDRDVLDVLRRRPRLVGRYLAVEGQRALLLHEHLLSVAARSLLDPGRATSSASPAGSLALALAGAGPDGAPPLFGTIRPGQVTVAAEEGPADDRAVRAHLPSRPGEALRHFDDDDEQAADDLVVDLSSPVGGGGGIGRLLGRLFGDGRSSGGGPPGADAPTRWSSRARPAGAPVAVSSARPPAPDGGERHVRTGFRYPEWDRRRRAYKPDWCTVIESDAALCDLAPFPVPAGQALRRSLARLGMEFERRHRQLDGDELDVDAVVEARAELAAGTATHEALYVASVRRHRDLSVLVLLDVSGSAAEPGVLGVPVHEHQRQAAAALVSALHGLGDRVALYGFRSQGRSAVHVVPVKRFGDAFDELVLERLGGLVPGAYTRLGAAIRHGGAVLEDQAGTARRLLVVLSDGFAYDHGYERAYGEADARRALVEVRRKGIGCLCLSIGAGNDASALRRVFGTAAHAVVPRVEQLPSVVGPLLRSAVGSAEAQRKAYVTRTRASGRLGLERRTA